VPLCWTTLRLSVGGAQETGSGNEIIWRELKSRGERRRVNDVVKHSIITLKTD
jgi:hypothetical protein